MKWWWWGPLCTWPTCLVVFFIVLAHWKNSSQIYLMPHLDTLSWFWANQSLLFLLKTVLTREATNTNFIVFGLTRSGLKPTIYHTRGEHTNHYSTDAVISSIDVCLPFYFSYFTATDLKKKIQQWKNDKRKSKK